MISQTSLILYRGIAVRPIDAQQVLNSILNGGIKGNEGRWRFLLPDPARVRAKIPDLLSAQRLSTHDIFSETPFNGICACGDTIGAYYYALKHNRTVEKSFPILIKFRASIDDIYVDSCDFLCTAFQFWDRETKSARAKQALVLEELFGQKILLYFDRCAREREQSIRIALCNLAAFDIEVVLAHYNNRKIIRGRYGTTFCSAFYVKAPVNPSQIISCEPILDKKWIDPKIDVNIANFLDGSL